jgi:hypothetical protein
MSSLPTYPRHPVKPPKPGPGDDVACVKCGAVALDTGLECDECLHDNYEAVTGKPFRAGDERCRNSVVEACVEYPNVGDYIAQVEAELAEARRERDALRILLESAGDMLHECGLRDEIWAALAEKEE